jgi:bacterioferritin (cytochrome b1)
MKGNEKLLAVLERLLDDELTAINQYMVHSEMINNGTSDELVAVRSYNEAIKMARSVDDQGTVDLFSKILKMEEGYVDWAEIQCAQIEQTGGVTK